MTHENISEGERQFIIDGVRHNIRNDGRQRLDVDAFDIELDVLPFCVCSAKVTLHSTQVIVGFKLEVTTPDIDAPHRGKIQCSARYSPSAAIWKRNFELESMNFDVSRELQNIMSNANDIDLSDLCIIKNRLCWIIYIDAVILADHGNVFDALCLGCNACFKTLRIPSLQIKNAEQYMPTDADNTEEQGHTTSVVDTDSLFRNTEISQKIQIERMRQSQKTRPSKFSGQELPFQDSLNLQSAITIHKEGQSTSTQNHATADMDDIGEIEFSIEELPGSGSSSHDGKALNGANLLPIIVTIGVMDDAKYFIIDPLYDEELCCDVLIRIAVYSNGNISVIKCGEKPIDPLLIFEMIECGKCAGMQWLKTINEYIHAFDECLNEKKAAEDGDEEIQWSTFAFDETQEKALEMDMRKKLEKLSFITKELEHDKQGGNDDGDDVELEQTQVEKIETVQSRSTGLKAKTIKGATASVDDEEMIIID